MVKSVHADQNILLKELIQLHCPKGISCDPTYGYGGFYKEIDPPACCSDLDPKIEGIPKEDATDLPHPASSFDAIMLDPPFLVGSSSQSSIMGNKYGSFPSTDSFMQFASLAAREAYRTLRRYGKLIFKCQDYVHGKRNVFAHCMIKEVVENEGFRACDLFVLVASNRMHQGKDWDRQHHARKFHSYFWVFRRLGPNERRLP